MAFLCKRKADDIFEPKLYGLLQQWGYLVMYVMLYFIMNTTQCHASFYASSTSISFFFIGH